MKISDFKLAEFFIRGICKTHNCPFVDLAVEFSPELQSPRLEGGRLLIVKTDKLAKTVFQIIAGYLQNIEHISGSPCNLTREERNLIITTTAALVRDMTYSTRTFPEAVATGPVKLTLDREPFVWTVMRSIICPAFDKPIRNVRIIAQKSASMDGAKYVRHGEFDYVLSNLEIENVPCRTAYLLYETIRAHEMDPRGIIHEVFSKQELWGKFYGIAKAAFRSNDAINDFITTLSICSDEMGSVDKRLAKSSKNCKWTAKTGLWTQAYADALGPASWWYLGLIENMLEPARGSDWSGYYTMKPFTDELWNKIEEEKKRRGMDELPLEALLRVQSEDYKHQPDLIIQGLLSDNRVW